MAGLTNTGLEIKRLGDVITDMKTDAVPIFQDLVPVGDTLDTSDSTTIGRLIGLVSDPISDLWEVALGLYWAFDPNSSTGIALDNLVQIGGLTRNPPSPTRANVVVWGNESTVISFDQQVSSTDNNTYNVSIPVTLSRDSNNGMELSIPSVVVGTQYGVDISTGSSTVRVSYTAQAGDTVNAVMLGLQASASVYSFLTTEVVNQGQRIRILTANYLDYIGFTTLSSATVVEKIRSRMEVQNSVVGFIPQEANTINTIATPVLGWDSVNNPDNATPGEDLETDEELRERFRVSKYIRAQNLTDSIYAALLAIDGVTAAGIFENDTDSYMPVYDLPPHSFRAVVQGGNQTDIARAIWRNKPTGIAAIGNTSETIQDSQGWPRVVRFDRPVVTNVYIDLELTITDSEVFPANGPDIIRNNLIEYFREKFSIGQPVIYSRLFTPINCVPGHQVDSLLIGTSPGSLGTANINVPFNGVASLRTTDINITVT